MSDLVIRAIAASMSSPGFFSMEHPGVLVAKVGYFGVKSAKVHLVQMGTKPAKVGHLAAKNAKVRPKYNKKKKPLCIHLFAVAQR